MLNQNESKIVEEKDNENIKVSPQKSEFSLRVDEIMKEIMALRKALEIHMYGHIT